MRELGQVKGGELSKDVVSARDQLQPGPRGKIWSMNHTTELAVSPLREGTCPLYSVSVGKSLAEVWGYWEDIASRSRWLLFGRRQVSGEVGSCESLAAITHSS